MAGEVPPRELGEGGVAIERPSALERHAFLEQRIRQLLSSARAVADHGIELSAHGEKRETCPAGGDAGAAERGAEFGTRQSRPSRSTRSNTLRARVNVRSSSSIFR